MKLKICKLYWTALLLSWHLQILCLITLSWTYLSAQFPECMWLGREQVDDAEGAFLAELHVQRPDAHEHARRPELHVHRRLRPVPLRNLTRGVGRFGELSVSSTELSSPVEETPIEDLLRS